jgi:hypothetical protein
VSTNNARSDENTNKSVTFGSFISKLNNRIKNRVREAITITEQIMKPFGKENSFWSKEDPTNDVKNGEALGSFMGI